MSVESRLSKVLPALTAKERAILILNAWKEGEPENPSWRWTMPPEQSQEFNRYIGLMNMANRELSVLIGFLAQKAAKLELRQAWLVSTIIWQEHVAEIRRAIRVVVKEPITESEHAAHLEGMRQEWVPVEELAALLAEEHDWQESDWEELEDGEREVSDEAWDRALVEKEREIQALVAEGRLPGRGRGKRLKVQMGAFDDLLWQRAGVLPEDYLRYRVLPDDQAEEVELERAGLQGLQSVLNWSSFDGDPGTDAPSMGKISEALKETIAAGMIIGWVELRTAEVVLAEMATEFDGNDPLKPRLRDELDETKQKLASLQEQLRMFNMEVVLREPLEEELGEMREWVRERLAIG